MTELLLFALMVAAGFFGYETFLLFAGRLPGDSRTASWARDLKEPGTVAILLPLLVVAAARLVAAMSC